MDRYTIGAALGSGQWGVVRKAVRKADGKQVAVKKVRVAGARKEGVNFQVLREIKMLRGIKHAHVVVLYDVFPDATGESLSLVFELLASDLERVLYGPGPRVTPAQAKGYIFCLLDALAFLSAHQVTHRDIKPANLLLDPRGVLKLADFGYARYPAAEDAQMSYEACTLWYRPPELLFGAAHYDGFALDVWSAGCIFVELFLMRPLFRGNDDLDQLARIFSVLGVPTEASWPDVSHLRKYVTFTAEGDAVTLGATLGKESPALPLATRLLVLDPAQRPRAVEALADGYFARDPPPELRPVAT
jgi:cyclin-dependent kinase 7